MTLKLWRASRARAPEAVIPRRAALVLLLAAFAAPVAPAAPADPAACHTVRLSDVGWTDVTATTAVFADLLRDLGYRPQITLLSVPVTFASLKSHDIDVFLGNWMPAQYADRQHYVEERSIEIVRANLTGAKYTLAVPAYTFAAGLRDFADIERFAGPLNGAIYGIEAGNDGNRHVLEMIQRNDFGLSRFKLIESSEQGMLAAVERAFAARQPIVFLAWDPHPMNMRFELRYLTGGDKTFGPNYGGATVHTLTRVGLSAECPNLGRLLANLEFTPRGESEVMNAILNERQSAEAAARAWRAAHPEVVARWLEGVSTASGAPASVASAGPGIRRGGATAFERWFTAHKLPFGPAVAAAIEAIKAHGGPFFELVSTVIGGAVRGINSALGALPSPLLILGLAVLGWLTQRSLGLAAFIAATLVFIMNQGYWVQTLETLSLVIVAALAATLLGVPIGIASAHRPRLHAALRPVLDLMQTLPTFVYLIPTLVLFGLGVVPALISTVIFALPAPIRLTHLGIVGVPKPLLEAGEAFGATRWQLLLKVELPSAAPHILAGITQCIMLSLSMVVIGALVGAGGLGVPVVRALNTVQVGMGFEAGLAIVLLAIVLDRITRFARRRPD
jgi:glycine betaine/proline transport system substrate-binding protein